MSGINNLYQTELYLLNAISQLKYEFDQGILNKYTSSIGYSQISTASYDLQLLEQQLLAYAGTTANSSATVSAIIELLQGLGNNGALLQRVLAGASVPKLVVAGTEGTNKLAWSDDGIRWNPSPSGNSLFSRCFAIAYSGSKWVAGGMGTARLIHSLDGKIWEASENGNSIFTSLCSTVAYNGSIWVAGGSGTNTLAWSDDGIRWNASDNGNDIISGQCREVAYNGSMWVAAGNGTNTLAWSSDGKYWNASENGTDIFTNRCLSVVWGGSMWVAGSDGTNKLAWSDDGKKWNISTSGNSQLTSCAAIAWNGSRWVAGGSGGNRIIWSDDGKNWNPSENGNTMFNIACSAVGWDGSMWISGGGSTKRIISSNDGKTWYDSINGTTTFSYAPYAIVSNDMSLIPGPSGRPIDRSLFQNILSLISGRSGSTGLYGALFSEQGISTANFYTELDTSRSLSLLNEYKSTVDGLRSEINALASDLPLAVFNVNNRASNLNTARTIYSTSVNTLSTINSLYISSQVYYSTSAIDYINASTLMNVSAAELVTRYSSLFTAQWSSIQNIGTWIDLNDPAVQSMFAMIQNRGQNQNQNGGDYRNRQQQGGGLADVPTAVPVGSVGYMTGFWIGDAGNISRVVIDEPNKNIIFLGQGTDGSVRIIDLKGKAAFYTPAAGAADPFSLFTLASWNADDSRYNMSARKHFIYVPIDSGIYIRILWNGNIYTTKVVGTTREDANRLWFIAISGDGLYLNYVAYNLGSNLTESGFYAHGTILKDAFGWTNGSPMIAANYTVDPNSYDTYYETVKARVVSQIPPTYTVTPAATNINEGSSLSFTVTTTNVPNGTTLFWTVTNGGDFSTPSGSFSITNGSGSFSVTPTADATTEGVETFTASVRTVSISGTVVATYGPVTINDTSQTPPPTYAVTPATTSINEGSPLNFTVATTNVPNGTTLFWTVTNPGDFSTPSGSFSITNGSGSFSVTPTADATTEGVESFEVSVRTDSTTGTVVATSVSVTINDTSQTPPPTYTVTPAATSINEGSPLNFTVATTNVPNGTTLFWTVTNDGDFSTPSGSFSITNGSGSFSVTPTADATTEGVETFTASVRTVSISGTVVATYGPVTINDTSQTPPPTYTVSPAADNVNEGSSLTFNVATTNVPNGTTLFWTVTNPGDFSTPSGSFPIINGSGSFSVTPTADATTEGLEIFEVSIRTVSISGTVVATSVSVTINDTSRPAPTQYSFSHIYEVIRSYSSIQLPDFILVGLGRYSHLSSEVSYYNGQISSLQQQISSLILTDVPNKKSTLEALSSLWKTAVANDIRNSTIRANAISSYNSYQTQIDTLNSDIQRWKGYYESTLFSFSSFERECSTNRLLVNYLELEKIELNALSKFNATEALKADLDEMLLLISQGASVNDYFQSVQDTYSEIQSGGASITAADINTMYATVNILYKNYSTALVTATQNRALLPPLDEIKATSLKELVDTHDSYIEERRNTYEILTLSTLVMSSIIRADASSIAGLLSQMPSQSTIDSLYARDYGAYQSTFNHFVDSKNEIMQLVYNLKDKMAISTIQQDSFLNTILQHIERLVELGYSVVKSETQSGGRSIRVADVLKENQALTTTFIPPVVSDSANSGANSGGGIIGNLQNTYNADSTELDGILEAKTFLTILTTSTNVVLNIPSLNDAIVSKNQSAELYNSYSLQNYAFLSTKNAYEDIINLSTLNSLATLLLWNIAENNKEYENLRYANAMADFENRAKIFTPQFYALSTKTDNIRAFRPKVDTFIDLIYAESLSKRYYLTSMREYEKQAYYKCVEMITDDRMTPYEFDELKRTYDLSIQDVNRYINYRKTVYTSFESELNILTNSLRSSIYVTLYRVDMPTLPLNVSMKMRFDTLPRRVAPFVEGGLPTTTMLNCPPSTNMSFASVERSIYPSGQSTFVDTNTYGVRGRYVEIKRSDQNYQILQVIVVDATGKNVAFGRPVIGPTTANAVSMITNGQYDINVPATSGFKSPATESPSLTKAFRIDLGKMCDITSIQYLKPGSSIYNSRGTIFRILGADGTTELAKDELTTNLSNEIIDFRNSNYDIPTTILPTRKGTCGLMVRYVCISKGTTKFQISQVAVVGLNGVNLALGIQPTFSHNGASGLSAITDGAYSSRPLSECLVANVQSLSDYVEIDLGDEMEVLAVHVYNTSDIVSYQKGTRIELYTADRMLAYQKSMLTNDRKEMVSFISDYTNTACSTELRWPDYYGQSGLIGRYVGLQKVGPAGGQLGFTRLSVFDKRGYDVATFQPAIVTSSVRPDGAHLGVTNYANPQLSSVCYRSNPASDSSARYVVDLGKEYEICAIKILRCSDGPTLTDNTEIQVYNTPNERLKLPTVVLPPATNLQILLRGKNYTAGSATWKDESDKGRNAAIVIGTAAKNGNAVVLNGSTRWSFPNVNAGNRWSIGVWYKKTGTATPANAGIVTQHFTGSFINIMLGYYDGKLSLAHYNGSWYKDGTAITLANNQWTNIQVTWDGNNLSTYINGNLLGRVQSNQATLNSTSGGGMYYIGQRWDGYEFVEGEIGEVRIYNTDLTADQVKYLYNESLDDFSQITPMELSTFFKMPVPSQLSPLVDLRRDPEESLDTFLSTNQVRTYGNFGTIALSVDLPPGVSTLHMTDGIGRAITDFTAITPTTLRFNRLSEVNSVIVNGIPNGSRIILRGCDNEIVNNQPIQYYSTLTMSTVILGDFRNPEVNPYVKPFIPMRPLPYQTYTSTPQLSEMYPPTDVCPYPYGILARYVKVTPRDLQTALHISQVIVVDSNGINVAFEKETFAPGVAFSRSNMAVDGNYEDQLTTMTSYLSYDKYIHKSEAASFVSNTGLLNNNYWVVDLGKEYLINSIIYVTTSGKASEANGVIVELYNAQLTRVGIQMISKFVNIFGVEILDFRSDRSLYAKKPGALLEVRERIVAAGSIGCGMMSQYVRIEAKDAATRIKLSQLIAIDSFGNNIALYKPTYSPLNSANAYKVVDGKLYEKLEVPLMGQSSEAYLTPEGSAIPDYVEVNFGNEIELVKVQLIKVRGVDLGNIVLKIYNKFRDVVAILNLNTVNDNNKYQDIKPSDTIQIPVTTIGVNIYNKYAPFLIRAGLAQESVLTVSGVTAPTPYGLQAVTCASTMTDVSRVVRGGGGGIMSRFVRVYNIGRFVQVSQIMAYGPDGANFAYKAACKSDTIYPGSYVAKATDGRGGYYHDARLSSDSFKAGGKRYDFLEIDLGAPPKEIVGLRCIFPSDNQGQNIGTSIQLLDADNQGRANLVLARYVTGSSEYAEALIDFRIPPVVSPISDIIMPKIYNFANTSSPNGIVELGDSMYIVDTIGNRIWKKLTLTATAPTVFATLPANTYPVGITTNGTNLFVACFGDGKVRRITTAAAVTDEFAVASAYAIYYEGASQTFYVTSYLQTGVLYRKAGAALVAPMDLTMGISYPNSISFNPTTQMIYVSSAVNQTVYQIASTSPFTMSKFIGAGAIYPATLVAPSAISYVADISTLFISDFAQNMVFSVRTISGKVATLAGTGTGGYAGDGTQGKFANFDGPINLYYSAARGYLYVSDYNNNALRFLDLYTAAPAPITSTTSVPSWMDWETTTLPSVEVPVGTPAAAGEAPAAAFTQLISPSKLTTVMYGSAITAFCFIGSDIYYSTSNALYKQGIPSPIMIGFNAIVSIAHNSKEGTFIYVLDRGNTAIYKVGIMDDNRIKEIYTTKLNINTNITNPKYIGFDKESGRMYVIDNSSVYRKISPYTYIPGSPTDLGFELFIGTGSSSSARNTFVNYGTFITLNDPTTFVFNSNDDLILIDYGSEIVYKADKLNGMLRPIASIQSSQTIGLSLNDNLFSYVHTFTKDTDFPRDARTTRIGNPWGVAIDSSDNLYITSARPPPSYAVITAVDNINEGSTLTFNVITTNVATGTILYWSITNSGDFGTSSGTVTITGSTGNFTVTPTADFTTEGAETFYVSVKTGDQNGPEVAKSRQVTINDTSLSPTYTITPAANAVNEGSSLTFNVATTRVPNGTTLYWTVTNPEDFVESSGNFTITGGTGNFTVTTRGDLTTEGAETFTASIRTESTGGPEVARFNSVTINDTSLTPPPPYTVTPAANNMNENSTLRFDVTTTVAGVTTLYWTVTNSGDFVDSSGNIPITGGTGNFTVTTRNDLTTEGAETFTASIRTESTDGLIVATSTSVTINDTSLTPPPPYTVTPAANNMDENSTLRFDVTTTVAGVTTLYWTVTNSGDFVDSSGNIPITGGTGNFTVRTRDDLTTESVETFTASIRTESTDGLIVATSTSVTINDTSLTPPPTYTVTPAANNINEGSALNFTVATTRVANGTTLYWTVTNDGDFVDSSGNFTITTAAGSLNGTGSFSVTPTADLTTEAVETFNVSVRTVSRTGTVVATYGPLTINDTSLSPLPPAANLQVLLKAKNYSGSGSWNDQSDKGKNATLLTGTSTKNGNGNGIVLNGSTAWQFPNLSLGSGSWSASVWFKQIGPPTGRSIILGQQDNGNGQNNIIIGDWNINNNGTYNIGYYTPNNGLQPGGSSITLTNNVWTNIQVVYNTTRLTTYVNGISVSSLNTTIVDADGGGYYLIGGHFQSSGYVRGEIGEVRIYNIALTATQVTSVYNDSAADFSATATVPITAATYLEVLLRAKNYTAGSTTWTDESTRGRNATLQAGTGAKSGYGVLLNGNTYWRFDNVNAGNLWSIGVWYNNTGTNSGNTGIVTQQFTGSYVNIMLGYYSNKLYLAHYHGSWYDRATEITLTNNQWTNIQVTWNGNTFSTYINGNLLGSVQSNQATLNSNSGSGYFIGRRWDGDEFVTGEIGEVRIYKGIALTSEQVKSVYNESAADFGVASISNGPITTPPPAPTTTPPPAPTYTVTPAANSVNENSSLNFSVATTNVPNGTTLYWTVTNDGDFVDSSGNIPITTGSGSINGTGNFTVTTRNDLTTEGAETFDVSIRTVSRTGTVVATYGPLTINDTSRLPLPPVPPTVNLQVLLKAKNYTSGNTWSDQSSNGRNATLVGGTAAKNGNAIVLDGSSYWRFPNVHLGNRWSIGVWVKITENVIGYPAIITQLIGGGYYGGLPPTINLYISGNNNPMNVGLLTNTNVNSQYTQEFITGTNFTIPINTWTNIQATCEVNNLATYINGNLIGSINIYEPYDSHQDYQIGRHWDNGTYFKGEIGEVRIYNIAITAAQVKSVYNESAADFGRTTLAGGGTVKPSGNPMTGGGSADGGSQQVLKLTYNPNTSIYYTSVLAGLGTDGIPRIMPDGTAKYASLNNPTHISYGPDRNIYILEGDNRIRKIVPDQYTAPVPITSIIPYAPLAIIGNYSRSTWNSSINATAAATATNYENSVALMNSMNTESICTDSVGNLYFVNSLTGNLVQMDPNTGINLVIATGFMGADSVAIYNDTYVYITNPAASLVSAIDISNSPNFPVTPLAALAATYTKMAVHPLGFLYLVNPVTKTIVKYNLKTNAIVSTKAASTVMTPGLTITSIDAIYVDLNSNVYISVSLPAAIFSFVF